MSRKRKQRYYLIFFVLFVLAMHFLYAPFWEKLFFPFDYRDEIVYYAGKYQLDPHLVAAVIHVESGFDAYAVSPRGACGLMQIMPQTAEWAAEEMGINSYNHEMLFDPEYNVKIGTWYLSGLLEQFEGNRPAALAAYNGGRSRVSRWISEGIWDGGADSVHHIPFPETRNYVEKVINTYDRYEKLYK